MTSRLVRCAATVGLSLSLLCGSLTRPQPALALPEADIEQILAPVPVFMVTNAEGMPLTALPENSEPIASVFISRASAESLIANLRNNNPQLASQLQVRAVPLFQVFQQARGQDEINFELVPTQSQVEAARALDADFRGTPLFVAQAPDGGYLSINSDGQQIIPFFFEKQMLDALVSRFTQQNPQQAGAIAIQVVSLESFIGTLETSDNEELNRFALILSNESLNYVRSLQQQQQPQQPPSP